MNEVEQIKNIKEIEYERYVNVSSLEKLASYAIKYLDDRGITTTWTNVVIATYKLFPRKFAISEEYIDFPNAERINRTLMHLVPPKGRNYAIGSSKTDYVLTPLGKEVAIAVETEIKSESNETGIIQQVISQTKVTPMTSYVEVINSNEFKKYHETKKFDTDMIWTLYKVIPYTQQEKILKNLNRALKISLEQNNTECEEFITKMIEVVKR